MKRFAAFSFLLLSPAANAHNGHHHAPHTQEAKEHEAGDRLKKTYQEIEAEYAKEIQPIFDAKCAACHSVNAPLPWYSKIPIVHGLIEGDRSEAKEHLEISKGFPFAGHGEPLEDLSAIKEVLDKNSMPTPLYSFMNPSSKLTQAEKDKIIAWVSKSEARLLP